MAKLKINYWDSKTKSYKKIVRNDISDSPAVCSTVYPADRERPLQLKQKGFSNLTDEEKEEFNKLFNK
jgi:hypothetical protein